MDVKDAERGVVTEGERDREICDEKLVSRPAVLGIGGGGLDCLRRAARRSPILTARFLNVSCILALPPDGVRGADGPGVASVVVRNGGIDSSASATATASTPKVPARFRNRLTPAKTALADLASSSMSLSSSSSVRGASDPSARRPLAALAQLTNFDSSTRMAFRSLPSSGNLART